MTAGRWNDDFFLNHVDMAQSVRVPPGVDHIKTRYAALLGSGLSPADAARTLQIDMQADSIARLAVSMEVLLDLLPDIPDEKRSFLIENIQAAGMDARTANLAVRWHKDPSRVFDQAWGWVERARKRMKAAAKL